jgi:anti-sigma B factor antagonist
MTTARVSVARRDRAVVITIAGEIDLSNAPTVRAEITDAIEAGGDVVIDLSTTNYLDSTGVRLLFDLVQWMQSRDRRLMLVVNNEAIVRRVIVLTKLDDAVPVHATLDAALGTIDASSDPNVV